MRVLVFGPTGGTGLELCAQAIGRGHDVTAFARSPSKLTESSLKVEGVSGFNGTLFPLLERSKSEIGVVSSFIEIVAFVL